MKHPLDLPAKPSESMSAADDTGFLMEHIRLARRHFLSAGGAGLAAASALPSLGDDNAGPGAREEAIDGLEAWLTRQEDFQDVSRGNPKPHSLPEEEKIEHGLTPDTWKLQVDSDPEHPARISNPMTTEKGNAFDYEQLMELAKTKRVRFAKVMTCLNIGCPLGMGIWEGVPLRDVLWLAQPKENLRRVFYYGYHNDDAKQMFRSSLPVGRVLEDPFGLPPVILCYRLNGHALNSERGGPVRVVVPEAYGFKSIKWLTHMYLSNLATANDTYAEKNNDVDSPLKTFCATLSFPTRPKPAEPIPITGWAQVGISGLAKVQVWVHRADEELPKDDPYYTKAPWRDAEILPWRAPPGGDLLNDQIPDATMGFDPKTHLPDRWPMRLTRAHWAFIHDGLPEGKYIMRCRTIDENGHAQPMPRPFRKSGHAAIEQRRIQVTES